MSKVFGIGWLGKIPYSSRRNESVILETGLKRMKESLECVTKEMAYEQSGEVQMFN